MGEEAATRLGMCLSRVFPSGGWRMGNAYHGPLTADYIVVGAGSAGCVIANRLSEDPKVEVILVEAGGEANSFISQLPAGFAKLVGNPRFDWGYEQKPDPTINGRHYLWS